MNVNEEHRPDWTHVDFENGEDADCSCGFNGTHQECEAARANGDDPQETE